MTTKTRSRAPLMGRGDCDRTAAVTRSLLGYGVLAGPFYVVVGVIQGLTRHGFNFAKHDLSLLANGSLGWIQITNLALAGAMTIAAAIGIRRSLQATDNVDRTDAANPTTATTEAASHHTTDGAGVAISAIVAGEADAVSRHAIDGAGVAISAIVASHADAGGRRAADGADRASVGGRAVAAGHVDALGRGPAGGAGVAASAVATGGADAAGRDATEGAGRAGAASPAIVAGQAGIAGRAAKVAGRSSGGSADGRSTYSVGGRGATWGPRLVAGYGIGLVLAGFFVADPMNGFPVGAPSGKPAITSWHSLLHIAAGGIGFLCLIAACFVLARNPRFSRARAWYSRCTGLLFGVSFLGIASGSGSPAVVLGFSAGVLLAWTWLATTSIHLYRSTPLFTSTS